MNLNSILSGDNVTVVTMMNVLESLLMNLEIFLEWILKSFNASFKLISASLVKICQYPYNIVIFLLMWFLLCVCLAYHRQDIPEKVKAIKLKTCSLLSFFKHKKQVIFIQIFWKLVHCISPRKPFLSTEKFLKYLPIPCEPSGLILSSVHVYMFGVYIMKISEKIWELTIM